MRFRNRIDAGQRLAARLTKYGGRSDVIVLGLPRGGVPVAHEVAMRLKAPLDVFLVRKLGVPGHPELAMGRHIMTDQDLKRDVQSTLDWDPAVDTRDVGISVDEGVVTLRGNVKSYTAKLMAERAAFRVYGVKAVANDLVVLLPSHLERTDTEIARAVLAALKWNSVVPVDRVAVAVSDGCVTLTGTLELQYQKDAATRAIRDLTGVKGVSNQIVIVPEVKATDVKDKIEAEFKRSAEIDARRINVTTTDGNVILSGNVHSWAELRTAERAAWAAPGVTHVEDRLTIIP